MAPVVGEVAVVAVIDRLIILAACWGVSLPLLAAVLPEERADIMYHHFEGGGVEVDGPAVLVRKSIGDSVSLKAKYYVDTISSASVDVMSSASPYTEERTETDISVDYLRNRTLMTLAYNKSDESDYLSQTGSFDISHDMFGDLTTVSLGYSVGSDDIGNNTDESFSKSANRQNFRLGLTQILTKNSLLSVNFETISDEGFLHSPYRSYRYLDDTGVILTAAEKYPETHISNALALYLKYYLSYRAALSGGYRYYSDTWGVKASNMEIGYTHPFWEVWTFDVHYRYYTQTAADFYSDLFSRVGGKNYMARDKELSTFKDQTLGFGVSYEFKPDSWQFIDRGSLNFELDYMKFNYKDFRDASDKGATAGQEPLYAFSANVIKAFLSIWY